MSNLNRADKASLILQTICKRSAYTQSSGLADRIWLDLGKSKKSLIDNLYTLVVLGEKGGDKQEA